MVATVSHNLLIGNPSQVSPDLLSKHFGVRKSIFVDKLKWSLPEYDGGPEEKDRFDLEGTRYVFIWHNDELVYSMRLLEGKSTMFNCLWPEALAELDVPDHVVEMSRFVAHAPIKCTAFTRASLHQLFGHLSLEGYSGILGTMDKFIMRFYTGALNNSPTRKVKIDKDIVAGYWEL